MCAVRGDGRGRQNRNDQPVLAGHGSFDGLMVRDRSFTFCKTLAHSRRLREAARDCLRMSSTLSRARRPAPQVEDFLDLLKRLGIDAGDACERLLECEDREQHDPDRERQAGGHQSLGPGVPRAEEKAEADRDGAATEQHAQMTPGTPDRTLSRRFRRWSPSSFSRRSDSAYQARW